MNKIEVDFLGDLTADLSRDYKALLSIGISEQDAESIVIEDYLDHTLGQTYEAVFWIVFAHVQWKLGRLSPYVKAKAFERFDKLLRYDKIEQIYHLVQSPMPAPKKLRKPTTHHCPWEVGSLLAYRIVNCEKVADHPCFGKYALLRVVKIDQDPVTRLAPCSFYDETMRVCVYGWIGDHIPDPKITDELEYIPIFDGNYWAFFDWAPSKYEKPDITFLGCDHSFRDNLPSNINFDAIPHLLIHCRPLDILLTLKLSSFYRGENTEIT